MFSWVCGKLVGYHVGLIDGATHTGTTICINSNYSNDISLTHGNPCGHSWTSMAGITDNYLHSNCPWGTKNHRTPHHLLVMIVTVSLDVQLHQPVVGKFHPYDPLWESHQCDYSIETVCCQCIGICWFYTTFSYSTTDYIDVRICVDEGTSDKGSPIGQHKIYVK